MQVVAPHEEYDNCNNIINSYNITSANAVTSAVHRTLNFKLALLLLIAGNSSCKIYHPESVWPLGFLKDAILDTGGDLKFDRKKLQT